MQVRGSASLSALMTVYSVMTPLLSILFTEVCFRKTYVFFARAKYVYESLKPVYW